MAELSGMLDGLGLSAIVRFLTGVRKTGSLQLAQQDWSGEIHFVGGELTHAVFGSHTGLSALDALIEVLPRAAFTFNSQATAAAARTIQLDHASLLAHMDAVAARKSSGPHSLPAADAVPRQLTSDSETEEQLQLDRGSLQTLLAVDGERSVREIVARRGSFDALWQLGKLVDVGLIQLDPPRTADSAAHVVPRAPAARPVQTPPANIEAASVPPTPAPTAPEIPSMPSPALTEAAQPSEQPVAAIPAHCPKLGFDDDPSSSFGRPTRLHRCFAADRPLPLSLDQQRELCLTDQFGTCPRLIGTTNAPGRPVRSVPPRAGSVPEKDPRIVRLPVRGRPVPPEREAATGAVHAPIPLRESSSTVAGPRPLRARMGRAADSGAHTLALDSTIVTRPRPETTPTPTVEPAVAPPASVVLSPDTPVERRIGQIPLRVIPIIGVAVIVAAVIAYLLLPGSDSLLRGDDSLDPSLLPNSSRVVAGTPVSALPINRPTPAAAQATLQTVQESQPTVAPTAASGQALPGVVAQPTPAVGAQPTGPLFDERFATNDARWPNNPLGPALITNGTYRIAPRQAGQFVAVSAPVANIPDDAVISATFRKLAGPPGGGYGIIVRDQDQVASDGTRQDGHYYVLEAGDKGEVGIWRRDGDRWVDLLPWQHADAVKTDTGTNELVVRAVGAVLSLSVNGTPVATRTDATFASGSAGLFVGGDGNQVAVSRFTVEMP